MVQKIQKDFIKTDENIALRAGAIVEGSSEIQIFLDFLRTGHGHALVDAAVASSIFKNTGARDFLKKFMGTLGEQLALKLFAKGKLPKEEQKFVRGGKVMVTLRNEEGSAKDIEEELWLIYKQTNMLLNGFCNLEKGAEEELLVGYYDSSDRANHEVARLDYKDKDYFHDINDPDELARRMNEPFDEESATDMKIIGQFVDYHGLAHRYHFSFQARREQETYGKQKILCIVENEKVSQIIDYLKPENRKNVCIFGKGTKDRDGKTDKIKIEMITEDLNFDPYQIAIV